jgi:hypothetical protein
MILWHARSLCGEQGMERIRLYGCTVAAEAGGAVDAIREREWVAQCARRLRQHWRTIDLASLEEVARELYRDERMRFMSPADAAVAGLGLGVCVAEPPAGS